MLKEFKEFAMRGNVVDMAVGIINRLKRAEDAKTAAPAAPPEEVVLLRGIHDALRK